MLRLSIPESPRFTLDVLDDTRGAAVAVAKVYGKPRKRQDLKAPHCTWQGPQSDEIIGGQRVTMTKSTSSLADFYKFIWIDGNWRYLAGTSVCWLLFDFAFCGLGLTGLLWQLGTLWISNEPGDIDIAQWSPVHSNHTELPAITFLRQQASSRVDISIVGTLVGCFLAFFSVTYLAKRKLQLFGFIGLFTALLFLGVQFTHFSDVSQSPLTLFLFCLCQVYFNFGPNTTTFMLPAEIFPTRYRGTAYGLSAAIGKLGSIVAQYILQGIMTSIAFPTSLVPNRTGSALLLVSAFMLIGAFVTWQWVPEPQWSGRPGTVLGKWKSTVLSRWIGMKSGKEATVGRCPSTGLSTEVEVLWKD